MQTNVGVGTTLFFGILFSLKSAKLSRRGDLSTVGLSPLYVSR